MNFFKQAYKGENNWWKVVLILAIFLLPFFKIFLKENYVDLLLPNPLYPEDKNLIIALNLSVYVLLLGAFLVVFRLFHKRSFLSLITARKRFDWMRFWFSFGSWGALLMIMLLSSVFYSPEEFEWNFKPASFFNLFIISLIFIPFKVFFKVLLLRGYLFQITTMCVRKTWIALIVVIFVYNLFTYLGDDVLLKLVGNQMIIRYVGTAFFIGLIVILDDGLEIVLGMTLVSNLISSLFITSKNVAFQPDSVLIKDGDINVFILVYVTVFLLYPLYFYFLKKMYGWSSWKEKLFKEVEKSIT